MHRMPWLGDLVRPEKQSDNVKKGTTDALPILQGHRGTYAA